MTKSQQWLTAGVIAAGTTLVGSEAMAAIAVTDIIAPATDAYDAAVAVMAAYGKVVMIPVAVIATIWLIGKGFVKKSA